MPTTDFAAMQPERKRAWGRAAHKQFRDELFTRKFMGGENSPIERITELTKTAKGTSEAMMHMVADLQGGGVTGDNNLEGREDSLQSYWLSIGFDQLRKALKDKGRVSDQKSVINFRNEAKDKLMRWMAEQFDDLCMLTLSGISYGVNLDGSTYQAGGEDSRANLEFAADVKAPSASRHFRFDGTSLAAGDTTAIDSNHVMKYGALVDLAAEARTRRIRPIKSEGKEYYAVVMHPRTYAALKKDADFRNALVTAGPRGDKNPVFTGADVTMDGLVIHTSARVFNTARAASGSKWGAAGAVNGTRSLLLGCQSLGVVDLGAADWEEELFDYGNRQGIAVSKMFGMLKPQWMSRYEGTVEDFGVMVLDTFYPSTSI